MNKMEIAYLLRVIAEAIRHNDAASIDSLATRLEREFCENKGPHDEQ